MRNWMWVSTVVSMLWVAGCAGPQDEDTLTVSIRAFNEGVRWQRYTTAASALPVDQRGEFVDEMDALSKDLRITEYEVIRVDPRGKHAAKVTVKVSWYRDDEGVLRETYAIQTWERRHKKWWMVDARRSKGDEMPGINEPVDLDAKPEPEPEPEPEPGNTRAAAASDRT